jgi:hypothetical protein
MLKVLNRLLVVGSVIVVNACGTAPFLEPTSLSVTNASRDSVIALPYAMTLAERLLLSSESFSVDKQSIGPAGKVIGPSETREFSLDSVGEYVRGASVRVFLYRVKNGRTTGLYSEDFSSAALRRSEFKVSVTVPE